MTINSNTQSFTSLNGAIKVTKLDNSDSSSKKLSDAVSVNISSNATSNTSSLLSSLKEETVIQARNDYKGDSDKRAAIHKAYYTQVTNENKKFANPYAHSSEKYFDIYSPYYIQGLTDKEREIASSTEIQYLNGGGDCDYRDAIFKNEPPINGIVEVAEEKAFNREKVNTQFQSLLKKYNVTVPQDTKLSFTIDPNTLKATVSGTDDKTLAKSVEDVINTADNATELFYHISSSVSDDSTQYTPRQYSKFNLTKQIKDVTGYTLKDLEIKDGKFITPDGTDVAEIYTKKINENPKMSDYYKMMSIGSNVADLKKLAKDGFDSVPDLVLSIDYQNGSFYDVKQSENFGTQKSGWINELKQARTTEYMAHKNDDEEYQSQYLDTTQFTKKYNDIDLTSKKNSTSSDNKEVLTKDELMLKYLLGNDEKSKNDDFQEIIEKLRRINEQN